MDNPESAALCIKCLQPVIQCQQEDKCKQLQQIPNGSDTTYTDRRLCEIIASNESCINFFASLHLEYNIKSETLVKINDKSDSGTEITPEYFKSLLNLCSKVLKVELTRSTLRSIRTQARANHLRYLYGTEYDTQARTQAQSKDEVVTNEENLDEKVCGGVCALLCSLGPNVE